MFLRTSMYSLGAEDDQPAVAPAGQAIGRVPVTAHVPAHLGAVGGAAAHHEVVEILEGRILRIVVVGDLRHHDAGGGRAGEAQELVGLM